MFDVYIAEEHLYIIIISLRRISIWPASCVKDIGFMRRFHTTDTP